MFRSIIATTSRPGLLVSRLVLAAVMFPHGAQHLLGWFGGYGFAGTHGWMTATLGIPGPLATIAILTEFFAPLFLVVGLGGRIAAAGLVTLMAVAASAHVGNGFFMNWFGTLGAGVEGFEYHVLAIGMAIPTVLEGSGLWSLDLLWSRARAKEAAPRVALAA